MRVTCRLHLVGRLAERRVEKALGLYDKWSKLQLIGIGKIEPKAAVDGIGKIEQRQNRAGDLYHIDDAVDGGVALEKANDDVLRIMDRVLDHSIAATAIARSRPTRQQTTARGATRNLQTWYGEQQNSAQIDFPNANDYFDYSSLQALRQAYDNFKRNDVVSDLVPHLKRRADKVTGLEKIPELAGDRSHSVVERRKGRSHPAVCHNW